MSSNRGQKHLTHSPPVKVLREGKSHFKIRGNLFLKKYGDKNNTIKIWKTIMLRILTDMVICTPGG